MAPRLPDNELKQALLELYTATKVRDAMYRAMISSEHHALLDKCLEADGGRG